MKTGTVRWFSLQKGYGFIHPDDGGPNVFVDIFAVECAGMRRLQQGQRVTFKILLDKRTGAATARSIAPLDFEALSPGGQLSNSPGNAPPLDRRFTTTNPFDAISDMISSAVMNRLRP